MNRSSSKRAKRFMKKLAFTATTTLVLIAGLVPMPITLQPGVPIHHLRVVEEVFASDQIPAPAQERAIAIVNATVHPVSGEPFEGDVLFVDGKIVSMGSDISLGEFDAEVIDAEGKHVYPALIAANTSMGLTEIGAVRATRDFAEVGEIKPNVRAEVAFNPDSEHIPVTRANGIALALSVPQGGSISGTSALMRLDGWTWEDMTLSAPVGLHVRWPAMSVSRSPFADSEEEQKKRTAERIQAIRDAFTQARAYRKAKAAEAEDGAVRHEEDLRWGAMIPVLDKEIPVFVHANEIREIKAALDWAEGEDLRLVIVGGYDAWRCADLLTERDVPVIVEEIHRVPRRRWEPYDAPFTLPLKLHQAGVRFCIAASGSSFESPHQRNVPYHAATAAAYGLPKAEALKSVTLHAAEILGVGDRVGSIEEGKDATLIVTDGDPLEITTHVEMMFIDGRRIDLENRHKTLYEKYLAKYRQLGLIGGPETTVSDD